MRESQAGGPPWELERLLELVERGEIDITDIPLAEAIGESWAGVQGRPEPDALAQFVLVAARLLERKAKALLPRPEAPPSPPDPAPRGEPSQSPEEYQLFREVAQLLRAWEQGRRAYHRPSLRRTLPLSSSLRGVTLNDLLRLVQEALAERPGEREPLSLEEETVHIEEKMEEVTQALRRHRGQLSFRGLLAACRTRREVIVLFLAVLELIKQGLLWAEQEAPFGEILLVEATPESVAP